MTEVKNQEKTLRLSFTRLVSDFKDPVAHFLYSISKTDALKVVPRMHRLAYCLPLNTNLERKSWSAPWISSKQDNFFLQGFSRAVTFSKNGSTQHKGLSQSGEVESDEGCSLLSSVQSNIQIKKKISIHWENQN